MASEASALKKVAVLTGLTMVVGGAEISEARAATVTQVQTFNFSLFGTSGPPPSTATPSPAPSFSAFDTSKGTLTEVDFTLDSTVDFSAQSTASVSLAGLFTASASGTANPSAPFDLSPVFTTAFQLSHFTTTPNISLTLTSTLCEPGNFCANWSSDDSEAAPTSLTLEYIYTPTTTATPAPAALPLFATGLGALGLGALLRRRKQNRA
jgi:MYXO-CTERM domain-containing protein